MAPCPETARDRKGESGLRNRTRSLSCHAGRTFSGDTGKGQYSSLSFDKFRGDQTITFRHLENKEGSYFAVLSFNDENSTTPERLARMDAIKKLPDEAARKAALREMEERGEFLFNRLSLGRGRNKSAFISLNDARGRERMHISVAADGTPRIDFLTRRERSRTGCPESIDGEASGLAPTGESVNAPGRVSVSSS